MKAAAALTILSTALVGQVFGQASTDSLPVNDNPVGVAYQATLPMDPFFKSAAIEGNVKGYVWAVAGDDGKGIKYKVHFENLPKEGGPFSYHIHVDPAEGGNCTKTLAHLDPSARGEDPVCDAKAPETCQAGDLSGKYGKITSDPFQAEYLDLYSSTKEGIGAFIGNRSFVLHYANKTRLTCANFEHVTSNSTVPSGTPTGSSPTMTPTWVNGAVANIVSVPLALAGVFAAVFAL